MVDVWLVQVLDDDYDACMQDVGIAKTHKNGLEMLHAYLAAKGDKRAIVPKDGSGIIVQEHYKVWSDEAENYVWTGDGWADWGYAFISRYTVDEYAWKKSE